MSRRPAPAANGAAVTVSRGLLDDVTAGVSDLAAGARDRALSGLTSYAHRMPGYKLLGVVLGRDVLTGAEVPRSAATVVGGFLELVPRGQEIFENLNRSGALERASAWFEAEVPKLGLSWEAIRALFSRAWDALDITDLADPAGAWAKIAGVFGPPLQALLGFARSAAGKVMEFVFEGALALAGGAGEQVMAIIRRAGDVLGTIVNDPVRFAGNLAAAVRTGLGQFVGNIGTHLQSGLLGWLTGALRGAVRIPARLDLNGIVSVVLDLLGLSWSALRTRLVRLLGERVVRAMETAVDWVQRIITGGLGAVVDKIMESATGLLDTVLGGIRDWVARSVVGAAVTRLISMFNPAGAVIQAIIAAYNTVQFFIERAQQLAAFASSVFDSIAKIAAGSIGDAANAVEQALARSVPVVLGFLARLLGLGDIAGPVRDVVGRVRGVVDGALDRVADWLASLGRRILGRLRPGRDSTDGPGAEGAAGQTSAAVPTGATAGGQPVASPDAAGDGRVVASISVTAAGHTYSGRAVTAGSGLDVHIQRSEVRALPAARASAELTASEEARAELRELIAKVNEIRELRGLSDPRVQELMRQVGRHLEASARLDAEAPEKDSETGPVPAQTRADALLVAAPKPRKLSEAARRKDEADRAFRDRVGAAQARIEARWPAWNAEVARVLRDRAAVLTAAAERKAALDANDNTRARELNQQLAALVAGIEDAERNLLGDMGDDARLLTHEAPSAAYARIRGGNLSPDRAARAHVRALAAADDQRDCLGAPVDDLEADHIVPLIEIVNMPGFVELLPASQLEVANMLDNFAPLNARANGTRSDTPWGSWSGWRLFGSDEARYRRMVGRSVDLAARIRSEIRERRDREARAAREARTR
ncbi:hypothetical protein [Frankia sp. R43]|uniref:hypothetical protein n=1 Tax=Frankia sp. R43 TaxID=269536 RepID=UPI00128F6B5D|nr:hypothetical protein [Frankia sp. R43]